jgi:hypothetical protein
MKKLIAILVFACLPVLAEQVIILNVDIPNGVSLATNGAGPWIKQNWNTNAMSKNMIVVIKPNSQTCFFSGPGVKINSVVRTNW